MKFRFYFDYSDYRSYLMLKTLNEMNELPIHIQWIAVDAFSLRALSGVTPPQSKAERAWLCQEASRFAARNRIPFIWKSETLHSGHALRAGVWLMQHDYDAFENYSRKMLEAIWAHGKQPDIGLVRNLLTQAVSHPENIDTIFSDASAKESFMFQDACLQQALADGAFDVATIILNDTLFCRFDQPDDIKREVYASILAKMPASNLLDACLDMLMQLDAQTRHAQLENMMRPLDSATSEASVVPEITVRHTISQPQTTWRLTQQSVRGELPVRAICTESTSQNAFLDAIDRAPENTLSLVTHEVEIIHFDELLDVLKLTPPQRHVVARLSDRSGLIYVKTGAKDATYTIIDDETPYLEFQIKTWKGIIVAPSQNANLNMPRRAAIRGCNFIVRSENQADTPLSEAWGVIAHAWIAEFQADGISVTDSESRRLRVAPDKDIRLSSTYRHKQAPVWYAPAPRTLLLCDHALKVGEISEGANLELTSRTQNLEVATAHQRSELASSRTSERLRIGEELIQIIPLGSDQVCIPEVIAHKVLDTLSKTPSESIPIFVNFWNDLDFDMLEMLRPVFAAVVKTWHMPLAVVNFNQVVEVWQCSTQNVPYRLEKEAEAFTLDLAETTRAENCFERMLTQLNMSAEDYIKDVSFS